MMHVSQIIMLYTLNLHRAVCQLYLKTERKKGKSDTGQKIIILTLYPLQYYLYYVFNASAEVK